MANITMHRGDTKLLKFRRKDRTGEVIKTIADSVYFTVKTNDLKGSPIFQKTLSDMSFDPETGEYHFRIEPKDTENLSFQTYKWDIQTTADDIKKTTVGQLTIKEEVTFLADETEV